MEGSHHTYLNAQVRGRDRRGEGKVRGGEIQVRGRIGEVRGGKVRRRKGTGKGKVR